MNADAYFFDVGRSDLDRADQINACSEVAGRPEGDLKDDNAEEKALRSKLLATGVVFSALNRLNEDKERDKILSELVTAIGDYDAAEDSFALNLERADGRSLCVLPNGKTLDREENVAWRVSFNCARDKHSLIKTKKRRDLARRIASYAECTSGQDKKLLAANVVDGMTHRVQIPTANACALYFVEKVKSNPLGYIEPSERMAEDAAMLKEHTGNEEI